MALVAAKRIKTPFPAANTRPRRTAIGRSGGDLTKCKTAGVDCDADGGNNGTDDDYDGDDVGAEKLTEPY